MASETWYIGYVDMVFTPKGRQTPACRLRPVAISSDSDIGPISDQVLTAQFPNRGLVYWSSPPNDVQRHTIWEFQIEDNHNYDPNRPDHEQYRAKGPVQPTTEVIDLRGDPRPSLREWLTVDGYFMQFRPSDEVFLWVEDELWVGPVSFVECAGDNRWVLEPGCYSQPLSCFIPADAASLVQASIGGRSRTFLTSSSRLGRKVGLIDWAPDAVLLQRVLSDLHRVSPEAAQSLQLTSRGVEILVQALEQGGHLSHDHYLDRQRVRRAKEITERLNHSHGALSGLVPHLLTVPAIQAVVEQAREQARNTAVQRLQEELSRERELLEALRQESQMLVGQLAQQRGEIERQVTLLEQALQERLAEVTSRPLQFLAEVALLRAGLGLAPTANNPQPLAASHSSGAPAAPGAIVVPWLRTEVSVEPIEDAKALRRALRDRARPLGLKSYLDPLHASFMAGAMPLLWGEGTLDLLEAYAGAVAGGRLLWLPISPRVVDPVDLIGHASSASSGPGMFAPAPGGLADVLVEAQRSDKLYLVVLDGANRAAMDSYLMPLLASYSAAIVGQAPRRLSVAHPACLAPSDPYYALTSFAWPPNVLLAGVLNEGTATLTPPPSLWEYATLIVTVTSREASTSTEAPSRYTEISASRWAALRETGRQTDCAPLNDALGRLEEHEAGVVLDRARRALMERFYAGRMNFASDSSQALEETWSHCLLPYAVAMNEDEALLNFLEEISASSDALQDVHKDVCWVLL